MKMKKIIKNKKAVSPVVGTILMIAVTIAICAVLWLSLSNYTVNNYSYNLYNQFSHINNTTPVLPDNVYNNTTVVNNYDNDSTTVVDTDITNNYTNNTTTNSTTYNNTTVNNNTTNNDTTVYNNSTTNETQDYDRCFKSLRMLVIKVKFTPANKHKYIDVNMKFKTVSDWCEFNHIHLGKLHFFWHKETHKRTYIYIYWGNLPTF